MQSRTNSRWLHRVFVFLLAIMVVGSYTTPQSFGMFGAQEAKAASEPIEIQPGGGTMELTGEGDDPADQNKKITVGFEDTAQVHVNSDSSVPSYSYTLKLANLPQGEGRKIKIELNDGMSWVRTGEGNPNIEASLVGEKVLVEKGAVLVNEKIVCMPRNSNEFKYTLRTDESDWTRSPNIVSGELLPTVTTITWDFEVQYNSEMAFADMKDAIKVTYIDGEGNETVGSVDAKGTGFGLFYNASSQRADVSIVANNKVSNYRERDLRFYTPSTTSQLGELQLTYILPQGVTPVLKPDAEGMFSTPINKGNNRWETRSLYPVKSPFGGNQMMGPVDFNVRVPDGTKYFDVDIECVMTNLNDERIVDEPEVRKNRYYIANSGEKMFAQKGNVLGSAHVDFTSANVHTYGCNAPKEESTYLGSLAVGNSGDTDSAPKTVHVKFDIDKVHVIAVPIPAPYGGTARNFKVKSINNPDEWKTIDIEKKSHRSKEKEENYPSNYYITSDELGLVKGDYIKEVQFDIGSFPSGEVCGGAFYNHILGTALNLSGLQTIGTIEVKNTDGDSVTTGEVPINTHFSTTLYDKYGYFKMYVSDTVTTTPKDLNRPGGGVSVGAGGESDVKTIELRQSGEGEKNPFTEYNVYICVPENATLDVKRVRLGDTPLREDATENYLMNPDDITSQVKVSKKPIEVTSKDGKLVRYYKLDFSNVPIEKRALGFAYDSNGAARRALLHVQYSVKTKVTTPGGTHMYRDNVFVELKNVDPNSNIIERDWQTPVKGNPLNLMTDGGKMFGVGGNHALTVVPKIIVRAQTESRTMGMKNYVTYDEADPQTILPIGIEADASVGMKTTVTNLSGIQAPEGTTTWIPIPKKGENWGKLTEGCKDSSGRESNEAPFSINLKEALKGIDESIFEVTYGTRVTPVSEGDYTQTWDEGNGTWQKAADVTDWNAVNCVRLKAIAKIPDFDSKGRAWSQEMTAEAVVDKNTVNDAENAVLVVSPVTYKDLTTPDGKVFKGIDIGEATAMSIATGMVKGAMFEDKNKNGKKDAGETAVTGAEGDYKASLWGGAKGQRQMLMEKDVKADGTYAFGGVSTDEVYDGYYSVRITNGEGGKKFRGVNDATTLADDELIVTPKAEGSESGTTQDNAFTHSTSRTDESLKGYAFSTPITAVNSGEEGGVYNLGVYFGADAATKATFTMDTEKGTMTDRAGKDSWVKMTKGSPGREGAEFEYEAAPSERLTFPKVSAKEGYKFLGWKKSGASADVLPAKNPGDVIFGYESASYVPFFSSDNEEVTNTDLQNLVNAAEGVDTEGCSDDSADALSEAIDNAKDVIGDGGATDEDRKAAKDILDSAIGNLESARAELERAVDKAAGYDPADYTDETGKALTDSIVMGEDQLNDPGATADELKGATRGIESAIADLIPTKEGLEKYIDKVKDMDKEPYTNGSVAVLNKAVAAAEAVAKDPDATVDDIKGVFDKLRNAEADLKKKVDAELEDAIADASKIKKQNYTEETANALTEALNAGLVTLKDKESTDADKDAKAKAIREAIAGLVSTKAGLKDAVDDAEKIIAENETNQYYEQAGVEALKPILETAKRVLGDDNATANEIKNAEKELTDAIKALVPTSAGLEKAIEDAEKIDQSQYTRETAAVLQNAIDEAKEVLAKDPAATAEEMKEAVNNLKKAENNLVPTREAIKDRLEKAENIIKNDGDKYTPETVGELKDAVKNAKKVLADANATGPEKRNALDGLNNGIDGLESKEMAALKDSLDKAKAIDTAPYTEESAKALTDAIAGAEEVLASEDADDTEWKAAREKLEKAVDGLVTKEQAAAKESLDTKIAEAEKIDTAPYTDETAKVLKDAIADAKKVSENPKSTAEQLKTAEDAIGKAIGGLKTKAEAAKEKAKADLDAKIAEAEKIDTAQYTDETAKVLKDAVDAAKKVSADPAATEEQLKTGLANLQNAINGLKPKAAADRETALRTLTDTLAKAEDAIKGSKRDDYTPQSVKALEDAIKSAKAVASNPNASKEDIDKAASALQQSLNGLVKIDTITNIKVIEKLIPASVTPGTPAPLAAVNALVTKINSDNDIKGSTYAPLKFMSKKQTKKSIKLQWSKVKGAKKYTVYANQCGKKNKYKKVATVKGKTLNVKKVAGKKLKKGTYYKFLLIAENGNKVNAISKTLHVRTAGHKKYANYKSVSVKKAVIKKAKKLKKGKTLKLNAKGVAPKGKKVSVHVKTRYESANKKIATVTKAGKVKGVKKGKTKIYCYAQNGLAKVVTVTVK